MSQKKGKYRWENTISRNLMPSLESYLTLPSLPTSASRLSSTMALPIRPLLLVINPIMSCHTLVRTTPSSCRVTKGPWWRPTSSTQSRECLGTLFKDRATRMTQDSMSISTTMWRLCSLIWSMRRGSPAGAVNNASRVGHLGITN